MKYQFSPTHCMYCQSPWIIETLPILPNPVLGIRGGTSSIYECQAIQFHEEKIKVSVINGQLNSIIIFGEFYQVYYYKPKYFELIFFPKDQLPLYLPINPDFIYNNSLQEMQSLAARYYDLIAFM